MMRVPWGLILAALVVLALCGMAMHVTAAVSEYARLGEDDLVFGILDEQYRTQLAGGAR